MIVRRVCSRCKCKMMASVMKSNKGYNYVRCGRCGKVIRVNSVHKENKEVIIRKIHI